MEVGHDDTTENTGEDAVELGVCIAVNAMGEIIGDGFVINDNTGAADEDDEP